MGGPPPHPAAGQPAEDGRDRLPVHHRSHRVRTEAFEGDDHYRWMLAPRRAGAIRLCVGIVRRQIAADSVLVHAVAWQLDGERLHRCIEIVGILVLGQEPIAIAIEVRQRLDDDTERATRRLSAKAVVYSGVGDSQAGRHDQRGDKDGPRDPSHQRKCRRDPRSSTSSATSEYEKGHAKGEHASQRGGDHRRQLRRRHGENLRGIATCEFEHQAEVEGVAKKVLQPIGNEIGGRHRSDASHQCAHGRRHLPDAQMLAKPERRRRHDPQHGDVGEQRPGCEAKRLW